MAEVVGLIAAGVVPAVCRETVVKVGTHESAPVQEELPEYAVCGHHQHQCICLENQHKHNS